jgi:GTPase SAR1 family protein
MSVIVIGDTNVGKTSAILALCKELHNKKVEILPDSCTILKDKMINEQGAVPRTEYPINRYTIDMHLHLARPKNIQVSLIDTRGELWGNIQAPNLPQEVFPEGYKALNDEIKKSRYIILFLNPYQEMIVGAYLKKTVNPLDRVDIKKDLYSSDAWLIRLQETLDFFDKECKSAKHIFICLNKADLFCDHREESQRWDYQKFGNSSSFVSYSSRIRSTYFNVANEAIKEFNSRPSQRHSDSKLSFFITTKMDRNLVEIPWLILGTYLGIDDLQGV